MCVTEGYSTWFSGANPFVHLNFPENEHDFHFDNQSTVAGFYHRVSRLGEAVLVDASHTQKTVSYNWIAINNEHQKCKREIFYRLWWNWQINTAKLRITQTMWHLIIGSVMGLKNVGPKNKRWWKKKWLFLAKNRTPLKLSWIIDKFGRNKLKYSDSKIMINKIVHLSRKP